MDEPRSREASLEKLHALIEGIPVAILTTTEPDGALRSRPMATAGVDESGTLWFFTEEHTGKAQEIVLNPRVSVVYAAPDESRFVAISGTAELVHDRERTLELWRPALETWFPDGVEDSDLALLRIDVLTAEFWEGAGGRLVQLLGGSGGRVPGPGDSGMLELRTRIGPDTAS